MKSVFSVLCVVLCLCIVSIAYSKEGVYVSGNFGATVPLDSDVTDSDAEITFDTGWGILGAVGYDFGMFRLEGELGYQENDLDEGKLWGYSLPLDGDVSSFSGLINGYVDYHNSSRFTPYITAGLGMANVEVSSSQYWNSDDDTVFAYQFGLGCAYNITEELVIDVRYRYFATEDPSFDLMEVESASNNFYAGLRYTF